MVRHWFRVSLPVIAAVALVMATPALARAQGAFEVSFGGGYTASEGVQASETRLINGQIYDSLDVTSGGSFGLTAGMYVTPHVELEFLWARQFSHFEASGPNSLELELADVSVDNYHFNFVYNYGESEARMRPFLFGGLGLTHYDPTVNPTVAPLIPGAAETIDSETQFSTTWGGGIKFYPGRSVGIRLAGRWTPTYIKSDDAGVWCDPFYPVCWVVADADYSNQFEFSAGVTFRFGGR